MGKCLKCNTYLPPGFTHTEDPDTGAKLPCCTCTFCLEGKKVLIYDNKNITKEELAKEYQIYLKKVREDNELLKAGVRAPETSKLIY